MSADGSTEPGAGHRGAGTVVAVDPVLVDGGFRTFVFVQVRTSQGLVGCGEATLEFHHRPVEAALHQIDAHLHGEDADRISHLWQVVQRGGFWRPGPVLLSALSGVEQALWDIKGQVAGLPVHQLLGGPVRDRLAVYANGVRGDTTDEVAASAADLVAAGWTSMKTGPARATPAAPTGSQLRDVVDRLEAVREAVGSRARVAVDLHGRMWPAAARRFLGAVEHLDLWFVEEPTPPEDTDAVLELARSSSVPIALGERRMTRWGFADLLRTPGLALVQPDVSHCGGIGEAMAIAKMAEMVHCGFAPHNPLGPLNTLASAHVAFASPNAQCLEVVVDEVPWAADLVDTPLTMQGGWAELPTRSGIGARLDLDACAEHPPRDVRAPQWRHDDGSVADW